MEASTSKSYRESTTTESTVHTERHANHGDLIRNFIIGFSDGLTVPFALTAGLSSLGSPRLVILAGLAELFSGAISMGLGAYLAAVTDEKHYAVEEARERVEVVECPEAEEMEIYDIFAAYDIPKGCVQPVVERLKNNPEMWVKVSPLDSLIPTGCTKLTCLRSS